MSETELKNKEKEEDEQLQQLLLACIKDYVEAIVLELDNIKNEIIKNDWYSTKFHISHIEEVIINLKECIINDSLLKEFLSISLRELNKHKPLNGDFFNACFMNIIFDICEHYFRYPKNIEKK